jgi:hypothetical protein
MIPFRPIALIMIGCLALCATGCEQDSSASMSAIESPIDFSYACQGESSTQPLLVPNERENNLDTTMSCPELEDGTEGHLIGLVLNTHPAMVNLIQLNPASSGGRRVLDADLFKPGFNGVRVATGPIALLRAPDWTRFYVVSAADGWVTELVIHDAASADTESLEASDDIYVSTREFSLPGIPGVTRIVGESLYITALNQPLMWRYDLTTSTFPPPYDTIELAANVQGIEVFGEDLLVTWKQKPYFSRLNRHGVEMATAGIRPQCSNGLDDDDDGLVDAEDPDCRYAGDPQESGSGATAKRPNDALNAFAGYVSGVSICADGLDNDADGLTDNQDPACGQDSRGEAMPQCGDGIDNDGDGTVDGEDASCYGSYDLSEHGTEIFGPYQMTVVEGGVYGNFVYILDAQRARISVFELKEDGIDRVDLSAHEATVPELPYLAYGPDSDPDGGGEPLSLAAIERAPFPTLVAQGEQDLAMRNNLGDSLSASRMRGELWSHIVLPEDETDDRPGVDYGLSFGGSEWLPAGCANDVPDDGRCYPPEEDDATWYVFIPALDGKIQLVEAIRRGVPLHRYAQTTTEATERETSYGKPLLTFRDTSFGTTSQIREGFPFLGPMEKEEIPEELEENDDLETPEPEYRSYGIWPTALHEQVPTETWAATFEGEISGTGSVLGRFVSETVFYDPKATFCDHGVQPKDWLTLAVSTKTLAQTHQNIVVVRTEGGIECPTLPVDRQLIEMQVVDAGVGQTSLTIDWTTTRLRPSLPALDTETILDTGISSYECETARSKLWDELGIDHADIADGPQLRVVEAFNARDLPRHLTYSVRGHQQWILLGDRSGFLHQRAWDGATGQCVERTDLGDDAVKYTGRLEEITFAGAENPYAECPPKLDEVGVEGALLPAAATRFENFSFGLNIFPGCSNQEDGTIERVQSQRGTRWTFVVQGPDSPKTYASHSSIYGGSLHPIDAKRFQMQLDPAGRRANLLDLRLNVTNNNLPLKTYY